MGSKQAPLIIHVSSICPRADGKLLTAAMGLAATDCSDTLRLCSKAARRTVVSYINFYRNITGSVLTMELTTSSLILE